MSYGYPPPWGFGYPPPSQPPYPNLTEDQFRKGMEFAAKFAQREEREKERKKSHEKKERAESRKRHSDARQRFILIVEIYALGLITYPFVGPAWNIAVEAAKNWK